jgi:hypothetical protein
LFFVPIPQIYNSIIATENGITNASVFLNNTHYYDHQVFPAYPNPLVSCPLIAASCSLPPGFTTGVTNTVSAFAPNFVTPRVQQASVTLEKEVFEHTTVALSYLYVHGEHLIRALDVNLPQPVNATYPIFDSTGSIFTGATTPSPLLRPGSWAARSTVRSRPASTRWDAPSPNLERLTNSKAPPPASTTEPRSQ